MKTKSLLKHILFLTLLCLLSESLFAQAPSKQWDKTFGGISDDALSSVKQTTDGGYIAGGSSLFGAGSRGGYDYSAMKINANGVKQWSRRFGGSADDKLTCLQQTTDGGGILGGSSLSGISGDKTQASWGSYDYWVVKLNSNGIKQWDKRFGGKDIDYLNSLQQTTDSGYILGGYSWSGKSGNKKWPSWGKADYWIVKIDANGEKQWDKRFGGADFDELTSLQQTTDGGYILGGYSYYGISGDKTENGQGNCDYWIVKIDASGIKQWDKRFGGVDYEHLYSIRQTADGGYILGGDSRSDVSGDKTQTSRGNYDYWIVKIDANGNKKWDTRFGANNYETLTSLEQTTDGGYILGGESQSGIGGDKTEDSRGLSDYWIVKINSNGIKQWDARYGGDSNDFLYSVEQTTDGGYILGGSSSSGISGDKTQSNVGEYDFWVVKLSAAFSPDNLPNDKIAKEINNNKELIFTIYPNPGKNILYVKGNNLQQIQIFNINNKMLLSKNIMSESVISIDISSLTKGMYWVEMKNTDGLVQTEKLFVQ